MKISIALALILAFFSCKMDKRQTDPLNLAPKLAGKWTARAFDGELHEEWQLGSDGWMEQQGYYIEAGDTTYAAKTRIWQLGDEIILTSVIKDANPKIFKSVGKSDSKLVFENGDYQNPFQVTYEFISNNIYRRTIRGYANDSLVAYEFNFRKLP